MATLQFLLCLSLALCLIPQFDLLNGTGFPIAAFCLSLFSFRMRRRRRSKEKQQLNLAWTVNHCRRLRNAHGTTLPCSWHPHLNSSHPPTSILPVPSSSLWTFPHSGLRVCAPRRNAFVYILISTFKECSNTFRGSFRNLSNDMYLLRRVAIRFLQRQLVVWRRQYQIQAPITSTALRNRVMILHATPNFYHFCTHTPPYPLALGIFHRRTTQRSTRVSRKRTMNIQTTQMKMVVSISFVDCFTRTFCLFTWTHICFFFMSTTLVPTRPRMVSVAADGAIMNLKDTDPLTKVLLPSSLCLPRIPSFLCESLRAPPFLCKLSPSKSVPSFGSPRCALA